MTAETTDLDIVRGEMRPWSDMSGQSFAAGGPVLEKLIEALPLEGRARVLVLGPHAPGLVRCAQAAAPNASVTVLMRSTTDAMEAQPELGSARVVVGALDGLAAEGREPFDVVVALDGLDRVLSFDSERLTWEATLRLTAGLLADDALLLLSHPLDLSPVSILDARPMAQRHGDNDWVPFWADATRPATVESLLTAVESAVAGPTATLLAFGPESAPRTVAPLAAAAAATRATFVHLATVGARATRRPLLADPADLIAANARAGRMGDIASAAIVVVGLQEPDLPLITATPAGTVTVASPPDARRVQWHVRTVGAAAADAWPDAHAAAQLARDTAQPSETARYVHESAGPLAALDAPAPESDQPDNQPNQPSIRVDATSGPFTVDPALAPADVPLGRTVADELTELATSGDVPGFRDLAGAVGRYVADAPVTERRAIRLDDLVLDGRAVASGWDSVRWDTPLGTDVALAAAFFRFDDQLTTDEHRNPWPVAVHGESLVAMWVEMAGGQADEHALTEGRRRADALRHLDPVPAAVPPLRTALADADTARRELAVAHGHIFGLERTIGFRDKQLRTREEVIRNIRTGAAGAGTVQAARIGEMSRIAKRASQVRSLGELTAGVERIRRRRARAKAASQANAKS